MEENEIRNVWGDKKTCLLILICHMVGIHATTRLPAEAITKGALGHSFLFAVGMILFGIPLVYMELIIGQFSGRDIVAVWAQCKVLSHIRFLYMTYYVVVVIRYHIATAITLHYLIVSFQGPAPYYVCGPWSNPSCDTIRSNYTVYNECVKTKEELPYCRNVFMTFPEQQYLMYYVLMQNVPEFRIGWTLNLSSFFVAVIVYLSCCKWKHSVKVFILIFIAYPFACNIVLLFGTMLQKGFVDVFPEAIDLKFNLFWSKVSLPYVLRHVVMVTSAGSGLHVNLAAHSDFRSPCYSNSVIGIVVSAANLIFLITITAMLGAPCAHSFQINPNRINNMELNFIYVKQPLYLHYFDNPVFWLFISYSANVIYALRFLIITFFTTCELLLERHKSLQCFPSLVFLAGAVAVFLISIPLLSSTGLSLLNAMSMDYMYMCILLLLFLECIIFVCVYGVGRFAEDVHFMQGIKPGSFMKVGWACLPFILLYIIVCETKLMYTELSSNANLWKHNRGFWGFITLLGCTFAICIVRVTIRIVKNGVKGVFDLNSDWGPESKSLQRSRAMFSAKAMTKEYLYRQFHFQAGIRARQRTSH